MKREKIVVIGLGYVGLPLALAASRKYSVFGVDINNTKIKLLKNKQSPINDKEIIKNLKKSNFIPVCNYRVVKNADIIIICVPTPVYDNQKPNLEPIKDVCVSISPFLSKGQLVVLESTVYPGVCDDIISKIFFEKTGLIVGKDIHMAHCPERINPGDSYWYLENIPRVLGASDEYGLEIAFNFYKSIINAQIKKMGSIKEAESVKILENSFRDINIAFINEIAMSFDCMGIDINKVIEGASTKPFSFMAHYPGCGVGGHCIPVDPYYLIENARANGFNHVLLKTARDINNGMPLFVVNKLLFLLSKEKKSIKGIKIAVLGLSYKADISDCRESPSFVIIKELEKLGAVVSTFDPFVLEKSTAKTLEESLKDVSSVIIATNHSIFTKIEPDFYLKMGIKIIIDGRNCLPKVKYINSGILYKGIGC